MITTAHPAPGTAAAGSPGLSAVERRIIGAIAEAAIVPGRTVEGGGQATVERMGRFWTTFPAGARAGYRAALWAMESSTLARHGRGLSALPCASRTAVLARWERSRSALRRNLLRVVLTPIKLTHFDQPELFEQLGCPYHWPAVRDDEPRFLRQVINGREVTEDLALQCEVVVIGTGAGGAAVAHELAARGRAVLLLEEGDYHRRASFTGRPGPAYRTLYRDRGVAFSLGNVSIPVWSGRAVGGTTIINSGTCYRAPESTLTDWRQRLGLPRVFSRAGLRPYYERAEAVLGVAPADLKHIGAVGQLIARGADRLGYRHGPVLRNAPDCDAQGVCCLGCPTGAKRSTDVSFVPAALKRGAQLVTAARVVAVDVVAGRARGVTARLRSGRKLKVHADAVVVAAGTLSTPLLLAASNVCRASGWLGRNLSVHPASKVVALFDERVDMARAIPQGYAVEHFQSEDLMFEGGSLPVDLTAMSIPWIGPRFTELIESYPHLALFGFMVKDRSRGRVWRGRSGSPLVTYHLNRRDTRLLQRGMEILCAVFQAAGAKRVLPMVPGHDEVTTPAALERLRASRLRPSDLEVSGFHLLGTCRIGTDPAHSCIGPDHEAHDVASLYVCDGSAVPSSLGVNPQLTIMAMALRAGEIIDSRLA